MLQASSRETLRLILLCALCVALALLPVMMLQHLDIL